MTFNIKYIERERERERERETIDGDRGLGWVVTNITKNVRKKG